MSEYWNITLDQLCEDMGVTPNAEQRAQAIKTLEWAHSAYPAQHGHYEADKSLRRMQRDEDRARVFAFVREQILNLERGPNFFGVMNDTQRAALARLLHIEKEFHHVAQQEQACAPVPPSGEPRERPMSDLRKLPPLPWHYAMSHELDPQPLWNAEDMLDYGRKCCGFGQSPVAWMRGHRTPDTPDGPAEYDVDFVYGDDPPGGEGWQPLYRAPPPARSEAEIKAEALWEHAEAYEAVGGTSHFARWLRDCAAALRAKEGAE